MKFSLFMMPLHLPSENPSLAFDRDLAIISRAEALGYDAFYIGEHHSGGWETMPSPEMILAKASALTSRIRLGSSMVSLPFHHPFHVAERFVFLDHLTHGRAILGVGPSGLPTDTKLFGMSPKEASARMRESLEIIIRLLETEGPINYDGEYWQLRDMGLQLRSFQNPRLPVALASIGSRRSLETAARYNAILLSLAGGLTPTAIGLSEQWGVVQEAGDKFGTQPSRDNWQIVTCMHLSETREQAWAEARNGLERDVKEYFYTVNDPSMWIPTPDMDPYTAKAEDFVERRRWIIGTPDDAIAWITQMQEETGGFGGLMMITHEWVPPAAMDRSIELFARYVMPHFRRHTVSLHASWQKAQSDAAAGLLNMPSAPPVPAMSVEVKG